MKRKLSGFSCKDSGEITKTVKALIGGGENGQTRHDKPFPQEEDTDHQER